MFSGDIIIRKDLNKEGEYMRETIAYYKKTFGDDVFEQMEIDFVETFKKVLKIH